MDGVQLRNFKDFLLLYNQISENCFRRCVNTFNTREVTTEEESCIKNCSEKYIHTNHKIMEVFMEVQPVMVQKRIEDIQNTQASLNQQQSESGTKTMENPENIG